MSLLNELQLSEQRLDHINFKYGKKSAYCIFCETTEYDGKVGLIHKKDCAILQLRKKIKEVFNNEENS